MGMFDSFYIEIDGKEYEIQTKQLDCVCYSWRLGDYVDSSMLAAVVIEDAFIDDEEKWFGAVIYKGFFIDYVIRDTADEASEAANALTKVYMTEANNPIVNHLVEALAEKTNKLNSYSRRVGGALHKVRDILEFLEEGNDYIFSERFRIGLFARWWPNDRPPASASEEEKTTFMFTSLLADIKENFPEYLPFKRQIAEEDEKSN